MGAFRRRTQFAAPLIITVAASCSRETESPPKPYPLRTWNVTMQLPGCVAVPVYSCVSTVASCNPPPPQEVECPPGASGKTVIRVGQVDDKNCAIVPPGCNELACAKTPAPCPLPLGQKVVHKITFAYRIEKRGETCHVEEEDHDCPPGVDCNPPKPRMIPCPPGIAEGTDVSVTQLVDGSCAVVPDGCTDLSCVADKTPCPL